MLGFCFICWDVNSHWGSEQFFGRSAIQRVYLPIVSASSLVVFLAKVFVQLFQQGSKKNQHWILRRNCASGSRNFLAGLMWGQPRVATAKLSNPENQLKSCYHWWLSHHSGPWLEKYIRVKIGHGSTNWYKPHKTTNLRWKSPLKTSPRLPINFEVDGVVLPNKATTFPGPVVQPYHHLLNEDFQTHP